MTDDTASENSLELELELYKLGVEMADRVSARRTAANSFYLTIQTALVGVIGLSGSTFKNAPWWSTFALSVAGIVLAASWWLQLRSYRHLNRAKFAVLVNLEKRMPIKLFSDEWVSLKADPVSGWSGRYAELGVVERTVPIIFACFYFILFIGKVAS